MSIEVSVVVPSRDRTESLSRCVGSLLQQRTDRAFEIIIVDDGYERPVRVPPDDRLRAVEGPRRGPAAARNAGIRCASGDIVLFTDDDAVADKTWLETAAAALDAKPEAVGVEGPVTCERFDLLYEHAVVNDRPGAFVTCNVGYRRCALVEAGGFDERFRFAHYEDVDLARRMARHGLILFVEDMRVAHPPRPAGLREIIARGRFIESEWLFHAKYPETRSARWPVRWGPIIGIACRWRRLFFEERIAGRNPTRVVRACFIAAGELAVALYVALTRWQPLYAEMARNAGGAPSKYSSVGSDPRLRDG